MIVNEAIDSSIEDRKAQRTIITLTVTANNYTVLEQKHCIKL